jgi:hypothetical protein
VNVSIKTGMKSKRRLLTLAVSQAALDDAKLDEAQLLVDALDALDVPHALALARLADEWEAAKLVPTDRARWGSSQTWRDLPAPIQAALVRTGAAKPTKGTLVFRNEPNRQEGISDFGLMIVESLRAVGLDEERPVSSPS